MFSCLQQVQRTQLFHVIFTQPGKIILVQPCTHFRMQVLYPKGYILHMLTVQDKIEDALHIALHSRQVDLPFPPQRTNWSPFLGSAAMFPRDAIFCCCPCPKPSAAEALWELFHPQICSAVQRTFLYGACIDVMVLI